MKTSRIADEYSVSKEIKYKIHTYERPELDKNIALKMFVRRNISDNFELNPYDDNVMQLKIRSSASPSGGILFKPIGEKGNYLKPQTVQNQ